MNRIEELRKAKGWSREKLADAVGTTSVQIGRLERGERRLTEDWMRAIGKALDVLPSELLVSAALAELKQEIEPVEPNGMANVARALSTRDMKFYRILEPALKDSGLTAGRMFLAELTESAIAGIKTGDAVVVTLKPRGSNNDPVLALRVFVAPDLLVTNRPGSNLAIKLTDLSIEAEIIGVLVPGSAEDSH